MPRSEICALPLSGPGNRGRGRDTGALRHSFRRSRQCAVKVYRDTLKVSGWPPVEAISHP